MTRTLSSSEFSALLQEDADRAIAGGEGSRRPCSCLPARPSRDHRVAFALGDVRDAARHAYEEGATDSEIERACALGRSS